MTVLVVGAAGVLLVLLLLDVFGSARRSIGPNHEVARPFLAGLTAIRPSISPGLRLAVGGTTLQRRRFWTTVALSATALSLLIGGLSFVSALERLTQEPVRYGAGWDLTTRNAFGDISTDELQALTADDPDIEGLTGATVNSVLLDGELNVPVMPILPITADLWPTVIDGTIPRSDDEILVGDDVRLQSPYSPSDDPTGPVATIVGTAVFPSIALAGVDPTRLGQGIAVTWNGYQSIIGGNFEDPLPDMIFFDLADGVDPQDVIDRYPGGMPDLRPFAATEWLTSLAPAEVLETDRATGLIWSVIALLGLTVLATLGHTLAGSVRQHRRDYTVLKALGFTKRQVLSSVTWQSTAPVVLALLLALPLGTALGRWWWRTLAHLIGVIDTPVVPVASLLLVAPGALVSSVLVAVRPGLGAARTPAATVLQDE